MFQQQLFEKILKKYKTQAEALTAVSELLFLNKSNVYRRLTGAIAMKPQEIELLARHYDVSLDELIYNDSPFFFGDYLKNDNQNTIIGYLTSGIEITDLGLSLPQDSYTFYFSSSDILVAHYHHFPELFYFKMIQWNRLLWVRDGSFEYNPYQMTTMELDLYDIYCKKYAELPMIEIFDDSTMNIILEQFLYTYQTGVMKRGDAELFIAKYYEFLNELEEKIGTGRINLNEKKSRYKAYYSTNPSSVLLGLGVSPDFSYCISVYNSPDIVFSTDSKMTNQLKSFFDNELSRATLMTGAGELTRRRLFTKYRKQLRSVEKLITEL